MAYVKNNWVSGEVITHEKLNHMEDGIEAASQGEEHILPDVTAQDNDKILKVVDGAWDKANETKELPAVTSTDNGKILKVSEGAWAIGEESGGGSDLPVVTPEDDGEVLTVVEGEWAASDIPTELPSVNTTDNGKVLTVVNGEWDKANVPSSSDLPSVTQEDDGKILRVVEGEWAVSTESTGGLSNAAKDAFLNLFQVVAYTTASAQEYYEALENALYPKNLVSISAVFTQGANVIYDTDFLDDLRQYLVVTAHYDDETSETISAYTLSGNLIAGTSTITVTYQNKTTTFDVNVTHAVGTCSIANSLIGCTTSNNATSITEGDAYSATITALAGYTMTDAQVEITMNEVDITSSVYSNGIISIGEVTGNLIITVTAQTIALSSISAVYTQAGTVYTTDNINSLKSNLVVTARYSDSSEAEIASANYTLSGTLTVGTSVITVSYGGQTTTFNVTVTAAPTLTSIDATFNQGTATITTNNSLDDLKQYLVVTANYSNGTTSTVSSSDYTLSGVLEADTSTIIVTYENLTDTFTVNVVESLVPAGYTMVDYITSAVHGTPEASHLTTTPYIKTNFPATDTDIINYSFELIFTPMFNKVNYCPFGGRNGKNAGTTTRGTVITGTNTVDNFVFGNIEGQDTCVISYLDNSFIVNNKVKFHYDAKNIYINDVLKTTVTATSAVQLADKKWALFARNNNNDYSVTTTGGQLSPMIGKIYSFTIKDANDNYILRYIPCKRNSDNVYGMYDTVSSTFFTSAISTAFSGGND